MVICKQHASEQKEQRQSVSQSRAIVVSLSAKKKRAGRLRNGKRRAGGGSDSTVPGCAFLRASSCSDRPARRNPRSSCFVLGGTLIERRWERRLDIIVREKFLEFVQVEDFDEVEVSIQDRL
jgi:hypothetical protein